LEILFSRDSDGFRLIGLNCNHGGPRSSVSLPQVTEYGTHTLAHMQDLSGKIFQDAKPILKAYTLRKRKEIFDWINELTRVLIRAWAVHTQRQRETAPRLAVESWLQRNGVITITQNKKVLHIFPEKTAHD